MLKFFEQCKQSKVRFAKIVINGEKMSVNYHSGPSKDWRKDWRVTRIAFLLKKRLMKDLSSSIKSLACLLKKNLPEAVDSYEPCFLLFRFDSNHDWILISFADDKAQTREKMLLAATKATFKSDFGQSFIRAEYQVANRNDLVLDTFEKSFLVPFNQTSNTTTFPVSSDAAEDGRPLSFIERELSTVAKHRAGIAHLPLAMQSAPKGIQFPIDQDALQLLREFAAGAIDFVQLSVDTLNEAIKLETSKEKLDVALLSKEISRQKPRYSLYRYREHESCPVFFIYSIPPSASCTIKELMLFSSCKAPFLSEVEAECGVRVTKKLEIDSRDKLDAPTLVNYITPEAPISLSASPQHFGRPPRPGRDGARVTKVTAGK